jgi:hypothetical protein
MSKSHVRTTFRPACLLAGTAAAMLLLSASGVPAAERDAIAGASAHRPTVVRPVSLQSGRVRDITFDNIKFPMEKGSKFERSLLTESIEQLDGTTIRIRGFILPSFKQRGLTQFVLVRDDKECCFGPGAALFDCVIVEMEPGKSTDFSVRPVAVEGVFSIRELIGPDGNHLAIYYLVGRSVR